MTPDIAALLTDDIIAEICGRFALDSESLKSLDGFENIVFESVRDHRPCVLRLSHISHRELSQVEAELHWVDFLAGHGVSVCRPIRSTSGRLTERIDVADGSFTAVLFQRAPGGRVGRADWTETMTRNRGRLLGRMHALTKLYTPAPDRPKRPLWFEENDFAHYRRYLLPEDAVIGERFEELMNELRTIPREPDSFGLIHMDAHTGNIFFDGDSPTLFDFDDCAYDLFVSDIAIALFYAVVGEKPEGGREAFAERFLGMFLEGYREEHKLSNRWLALLPKVLKRREMVLYVALHRGFDPANFDPWCRAYVDYHRPRIIDRTPYLDLDWSQFSLE